MVKHLYHECMSLEELLEESVNTLGPDARDILAQVRYLKTAFTGCCGGCSPFLSSCSHDIYRAISKVVIQC